MAGLLLTLPRTLMLPATLARPTITGLPRPSPPPTVIPAAKGEVLLARTSTWIVREREYPGGPLTVPVLRRKARLSHTSVAGTGSMRALVLAEKHVRPCGYVYPALIGLLASPTVSSLSSTV